MAEAAVERESANGAVEWRKDTRGREFVSAVGRSGVVYRQGEETIDDAYARDAEGPKKRTPKKRVRKPPAPTEIDLRQLEYALIEALAAPSMIAAMNGDEWAAQHFTTQAPLVARNLVMCSQHNPWLREKLVAAMAGEGPLMNVMMFASLGAAVFSYVVPPIIYYLNPPFLPERGVEMMRMRYAMPERHQGDEDAAVPEAPLAAPPAAAAA
jgi:hypothetical protein